MFVCVHNPSQNIFLKNSGTCSPGYGGDNCDICRQGTFKETTGSEECTPCTDVLADVASTTDGEGKTSPEDCMLIILT